MANQIDFSSIGGVPVANSSAPAPEQPKKLDFSSVGGRPVAAETPVAPQEEPGFLQQAGKFLSDIPEGFGKATAEIAAPIAKGIHAATGLPLNEPQMEMYQNTQANTSGESAGKLLENLGEFVTGEGWLKGVAVAERLKIGAQLAKLAEKSPHVARLIDAGMNVLRGAGVSGAQSALHANEGEALPEALRGAGYGAAGGAAGELLGAGARFLSGRTKAALAAKATNAFNEAEAAQQAETRALQGAAQSDLEGVAKQTTKNVLGAEPAQTALSRYSFGDAANEIRKSADPVFNQLRQESNGLFDIAKRQADNARKVLRAPASVEAAESAEKALAEADAKMEQVFASSKLNPEDLAQARNAWRQAATLDDLFSAIDRAFSKPQAAVRATAAVKGTAPEVIIHPGKYRTALNRALSNIPSERLAETVGPDGVEQLYAISDGLSDALSTTEKQARLMAAVKAATGKKSIFGSEIGSLVGAGGASYLAHLAGLGTGASVGVPVGVVHFLYTHPELGMKVLALTAKGAPTAGQVVKHVTHVYRPEVDDIEAVE